MTPLLIPSTAAEAAECVRSAPAVLGVGAGTKPRLSAVNDSVTRISTTRLRGIVEYQPEEFTITALAGTPVGEVADALEKSGQYLPFDPMFADAGATLGGTVAAGTSGPGRFRFGGVRDFILGVRFIDGAGRLLRMGGKVVKNAAGFDLHRFLVGSLGRFGFLVEITLKVFPRPAAALTVRLPAADARAAAAILSEASRGRWGLAALDVAPQDATVCLRLAGPAESLTPMASEILARWPGEILPEAAAESLWASLREAAWAPSDGLLLKAAVAPADVSEVGTLIQTLGSSRVHFSAGGNAAFISPSSVEHLPALDQFLAARRIPALVLRGPGPLWMGARQRFDIAQRVKAALDPDHRFPALED